MSGSGVLLLLCVVSYLMLVGDGIWDGGRPKRVALPANEGGYAKILRHGVLPLAHDRDDDIRAHVDAARRGLTTAKRWLPHLLYAPFALASLVLAALDRSPVALLAAVGWAGYPFASRWNNRRMLTRYDRIEADLDGRRHDARST